MLWFIAAFLIWREQATLRTLWGKHHDQLGNVALRSILVTLFWLLGGLGLYLAGCLADINTVRALSLPIVLLGLAHFYGGSRFAGRLTFPLLFLLGSVPLTGLIVELLAVPLQYNAARCTPLLLGLIGIPTERSGLNLHTAHYNFVVDIPCSGLKTGVALLTMSVLMAHVLPNLSRLQRCLLCLFSVPIALGANILRILTIVVIGSNYGTKAAEGFLHNFSGIFMFGIAMLLLLGASSALKSAPDNTASSELSADDVTAEGETVRAGVAVESAASSQPERRTGLPALRLQKMHLALVVVLLLIGYLGRGAVQATRSTQIASSRLVLPGEIGIWQGKSAPVDPTVLQTLQPDAMRQATYTPRPVVDTRPDPGQDSRSSESLARAKAPVTALAAASAVDMVLVHSRDFRAIHSPLSCMINGGWAITKEERVSLRKDGRKLTLSIVSGERQGSTTQQAFFFPDDAQNAGGWVSSMYKTMSARLLRRPVSTLKVQFAYNPRIWRQNGKIDPRLSDLVFGVNEAVSRSLGKTKNT